ncbi:MAG: FGGY-family carbohydrate kinase [bacterium]
MSDLFLGLDSSTQSLSAVVVDLATRRIVHEVSLNFDKTLPGYGTQNGVLRSQDPAVVHAPPLMWVEALDVLMAQLKQDGVALGDVRAVAGSGQQHGSVYCNATLPGVLAGLDSRKSLKEQLAHCFSRATSPIWMDSSTSLECAEIQKALGGAPAMAEATGSAAFERFTGPQIRKFFKSEPGAYEATDGISLVSSFMASLLAGRVAPIDQGDGAGMNLMDIHQRQWHAKALDATAPGLAKKLPPLAEPWTPIGPVSPYFSQKYGLNPKAVAVVWSGDNPCSVIGTGLVESGMVAISLGTSDTYFGTMAVCHTDPRGEGHVFVSPTGEYMTLICFKNGSLAREKVKDAYGLDWRGFAAALTATAPGNGGGLMLPWFEPEIVPRVLTPGVYRFKLDPANAAANCRAVVEAQMMSMKLHSQWMGIQPTSIRATGGGSKERAILQVMADVMGCPVHQFEVSKTAALGAALRAAHAWQKAMGQPLSWAQVVAGFTNTLESGEVLPTPGSTAVYAALLPQYADFESRTMRFGK